MTGRVDVLERIFGEKFYKLKMKSQEQKNVIFIVACFSGGGGGGVGVLISFLRFLWFFSFSSRSDFGHFFYMHENPEVLTSFDLSP